MVQVDSLEDENRWNAIRINLSKFSCIFFSVYQLSVVGCVLEMTITQKSYIQN